MANIVLIGMPGAGKTTIGKKLSKVLGRPVIDADDVVVQQTGRTRKERMYSGTRRRQPSAAWPPKMVSSSPAGAAW